MMQVKSCCADRLKKSVRAGEQLTVDYRCFNFEGGCLCEACTGLTIYTKKDFAETAGRVCCISSKGSELLTRRAVEAGTTLGFFVGELVLFDVAREQGILGMAQTLLVSSRPPWVPSDLWEAFEGPQGVVIDARGIDPASEPKVT